MKRLKVTIDGIEVPPDEMRERVNSASLAWLASQREPKAQAPKRRDTLTDEEKEEKQARTAQAKLKRKDERRAREDALIQRRIKALRNRSEREAAEMLRVRIEYRKWKEPRLRTVCSAALYSRMKPEVATRTPVTPSRRSSDGFKNIVLRKTSRGYGKKAEGTREYTSGEAADLVRYILRDDALEEGIDACFTNLIGEEASASGDKLKQVSQAVAFFDALEKFERDVSDEPNVYSHLILAMPHELSPAMRSEALDDFCMRLDSLKLPFVAALHKPDPGGDRRNFHAHIMVAFRPFDVADEYAWTLEASKASEFNLGAAIPWFKIQAAEAFNAALQQENVDVRYSGISQAERGVEATGERHLGPALTAKQRKAAQLQEERSSILRTMAGHLVAMIGRQRALGKLIERPKRAPREMETPEPAAPDIRPAIAQLAERYPDKKKLRGLSILDFAEYEVPDFQADLWFSPAFNLRSKFQQEPLEMLRMVDGKVHVVPSKLEERERALMTQNPRPDIVQEALDQAVQQFRLHLKSVEKNEKQAKDLRRKTLEWLRTNDVQIFDEAHRVTAELQRALTPHVLKMPGVREAMRQSHMRWMSAEKHRVDKRELAATPVLPAPAHWPTTPILSAQEEWEEVQRLDRMQKEQQGRDR